jgi:predicted nucleic acid-binding protein
MTSPTISAYLDASFILPTLVEEPGTASVARFLLASDQTLVVSEFAAAEVASVISRLVRIGALSSEIGASRLAAFDAWRASTTIDLDLQASDIRLANIFVRRFDLMLRAPDAIHAAVCQRANLRLVTLDRRLSVAATALGVQTELVEPGA